MHQVGGLLPPLAEISAWSLGSAWLGMTLYRRGSPQDRLAALRAAMVEIRHELDDYDGPHSQDFGRA